MYYILVQSTGGEYKGNGICMSSLIIMNKHFDIVSKYYKMSQGIMKIIGFVYHQLLCTATKTFIANLYVLHVGKLIVLLCTSCP